MRTAPSGCCLYATVSTYDEYGTCSPPPPSTDARARQEHVELERRLLARHGVCGVACVAGLTGGCIKMMWAKEGVGKDLFVGAEEDGLARELGHDAPHRHI